jgi:hypothetical protein
MTTQHPAVDVLIRAAASYGETLFTDQAEWYAAALQEAHLLHTRRLELNAVIVALTTFAENAHDPQVEKHLRACIAAVQREYDTCEDQPVQVTTKAGRHRAARLAGILPGRTKTP